LAIRDLTETDWDDVVVRSKVPVLVEFWAPWCPYCKQLNPIFEKVANDHPGGITFARVNIDEAAALADKFGVLTIPLLKAFCDSRGILEHTGFIPEGELRKFVDQIPEKAKECIAHSSMRTVPAISPPQGEEAMILNSKTIAIVGLSKDPNKDSYSVADYLKRRGFRIIPVNPTATEILGEKAYPSLLDIPAELASSIEIVDIFRPSDQVEPIVDQALKLKDRYEVNPKAIWMQLGVENPKAAEKARGKGISVVQNMCIDVEHRRLSSMKSITK
jgi:predicted CoA-binding protein